MGSHDEGFELVRTQAHGVVQRSEEAESGDASALLAQRALSEGEAGRLNPQAVLHLQRALGNAGVGALLAQRQSDEESPVKDVVRSSGQSLDPEVRTHMESRLGHDFSDVQIHTDSKAAASAKSVQAHAYTVGNHVVFDSGKYQPSSTDGQRMLAHELTHVVQQRSGPVDGTPAAGGINLSHPSDRFEQEAERSADVAMSASAPADVGGGGSAVQREVDEDEEQTAQGTFVQREAGAEEEAVPEEETAQGSFVQREAAPEEEMAEDETAQGSFVQREAAPEEEAVPEEETAQGSFVQREAAPEEEMAEDETAQGSFVQREADDEIAEDQPE